MPLPQDTWYRKGGLLMWTIYAPRRVEAPVTAEYDRVLPVVQDALVELAEVTCASWTTDSIGDDAVVLRPPELTSLLDRRPLDPHKLELSLNLLVTSATGEVERLLAMADVWVEVTPEEIDITLVLDADVHAFVTLGVNRDNSVLAELNQHRLAHFFRTLRERLDARIEEIDAPSYETQLGPDGFHPPTTPPSG